MTKRILAFVLALAIMAPAFAQSVAEDELSSVAGRAVEFINYVGPHDRIETVAEIRAIGQSLGRAVAAGAVRAGEAGRYQVIHAVDPSVRDGFDADIIVLGEGIRVDHIRNLRRIIAGYLEGAYAYSAADADTLAVFITIYNAVYRGDMAYFGRLYKQVVLRELDEFTAGLALRWDQWPGRSRIVIPLTSRAGTGVVGSVATTPISDAATVEGLRREDPAAVVDTRQDLVDIKEREVEEERAAIEAERRRIAAEEAALAAERDRLAAERERQSDQAASAAETGPGAASETGPGAAVEAGPGAEQEASLAVTEAARREEAALAEREAALQSDREELAAREEAVEAKEDEIASDRREIAQEQRQEIAAQVAQAQEQAAAGVVLFELMDPNQPLSRLVLVELATGRTLRRSELNTIRAATVVDLGSAYAAVAGQVTGTGGAVRLVRIDKADYAKLVEGKDEIFPETQLWRFGTSLYAVAKKGSDWVIGRFDAETLELKASSAPVTRFTMLVENQGRLIAQKPGSGFLILDRESLATLGEVGR